MEEVQEATVIQDVNVINQIDVRPEILSLEHSFVDEIEIVQSQITVISDDLQVMKNDFRFTTVALIILVFIIGILLGSRLVK